MNIIEKVGVVLGILGGVGGGFVAADNHFARSKDLSRLESEVSDGKSQSKAYYLMNSAEIQLSITERNLRYLVDKPEDKKDAWDKLKEERLKEDLKYWSEAVKKAEEKITD